MNKRLPGLIKLILLIIAVSLIVGSAVALFLWLLTVAIHYRFKNTWLLYLLPLAGILIHLIYKTVGKSSEKGNNLIIDEIHQPGVGVPGLMAPIILFTTIITHLFGGSAGREGTAVQIGGSIAYTFGKWFKINQKDTSILLISGVAAGFGAVFGTPLTGAIFAIEVLALGKLEYGAALPALLASLVGDWAVDAWQVHHTTYHIDALGVLTASANLILISKVILASAAFGLIGYVFAVGVHQTKSIFLKIIKIEWLIPVLGGLTIIGFTYLSGKPDYLSLGVDAEYLGAVTIPSAFTSGGADIWSWLWKTIYTIITLSTGFKGGEVTPLFYIGATLGNSLAVLLNSPVSLFAALGFIAVFAGATNTPLACTIMGTELFGSEHILLFAIACFTAYLFSGHKSIYSSQRMDVLAGKNYIYQKIYKYKIKITTKKL
ncbi:MAG: voltage-gated chloride channel protein [Sphingobacteriaceae bacterium]|nr:MAG: voltage-gated chloride channel protein [Sphingobacteriaceae bacterium]